MSKNLFEDLMKMAAGLSSDPAASKVLRDQYRAFVAEAAKVGKDGSTHDPNKVLDEVYANLKKQFEHINSPLGDQDE